MDDSDNKPEFLVSVPNDLEAAMIVSVLAAQDIDATSTGSYTAGFRAEAPGEVQVLVRHCDMAKARHALNELRQSDSPIQATHDGSAERVSSRVAATLVKLFIVIFLSIGVLQSCF